MPIQKSSTFFFAGEGLALHPVLRLFVLASGACGLGAASGCGSAPSTAPTTVHGVVQFQGYPLAGGMIVFAPDPERGATGKPARGEIAADGSFTLHVDGTTNVTPGWYRVAIAEPPRFPEWSNAFSSRAAFPAALRRPDRSTLLREVQAGKDNAFEFLIDAPPNAFTAH